MNINIKNPYDLPGNLQTNIYDTQILLETLNWINRDKHRRDILAELDLIDLELKKTKEGLRTNGLAKTSELAELEALEKSLNAFRKNVINALSSHVSREAMVVLQQRLENEFENITKVLIAILFKYSEKIKKMKLKYN